MVVCGRNSRDGGIYDDWGVPPSVAEAVLADLDRLNPGLRGRAGLRLRAGGR